MTVRANGVDLFYERMGSGAPLILAHGNGDDHTIFAETAKALSAKYTVYLPDTRGHGRSGAAGRLSYDDMAQDAVEFCRVLSLESPVFCGFSDGGITGLLAASREPGLFSRLIVCGANLDPGGLKRRWRLLFGAMHLFTRDPKLELMLREPHITPEQLARIRIPTLVLAGSRDMISEAHTRRIAAGIPRAELRILPGEGHGSYVVHSARLATLIDGL